MDIQKIAKDNCIFQVLGGSHLYGTATPESDKDYIGIFMPNDELIFGMDRSEIVDASIKSKNDEGRNTKDAEDVTYYEIRKFVKLAIQNNPNILELLYAPAANIVKQDDVVAPALLLIRDLFPYGGLLHKYTGYARSQNHKMVLRTDKFHELQNAYNYLSVQKDQKQLLIQLHPYEVAPFMKVKGDTVTIGDMSFQRHHMVRRVVKMIGERLDKFSNRKELMKTYGYDTKFASHLVRLLLEGEELLTTGKLVFPLKQRELILDIKLGNWDMSQVIKYAAYAEEKMLNAFDKTKLRREPAYHEINTALIAIMREYLCT